MRMKKITLIFGWMNESVLSNGRSQFNRSDCKRSTKLARVSPNGSNNQNFLIDVETERFAVIAWLRLLMYKPKKKTTQYAQVEAINSQYIYLFAVNDDGRNARRTCESNSTWLSAAQMLRWLLAVDLTHAGCSSTYLAEKGGAEPHLFSLQRAFEGKSHDA